MSQHKHICAAMSGGVDSSVVAALLLDAGHAVTGTTMVLHEENMVENTDISDARAVCDRLGIPHRVYDMRAAFRHAVMDYFAATYEAGETPNPCVVCNREIKFGALLDAALADGADALATGHFARIGYDAGSDRHLILRAKDTAKDQSYVLWQLSQAALAHVVLPLGELSKAEVRGIADAAGFVTAHKSDSQDICFVPDGDYMNFLRSFTGKEYACGAYLDMDGKVVGTHKGAVAYTIGQRKGLGLAMGAPVYVCSKDMAANTVTVGPNEALFSAVLEATDWNWLSPTPTEPLRCMAKARSRMTEQPATVYPMENGIFRVVFDEPQRAITPGQAVVLYNDDIVLGGGTITNAI